MKKFYPDYLLEILFFVFVTIELTLILSLIFPPPIGREIDFVSLYQPGPEWYFLWLYQLAGYFPGRSAFIGTILIPVAVVFVLILIPWIDKRFGGKMVLILSGLILSGFFLLTTFAW
ncbi:MAG: hypothetical protein OEW69_05095 [Nitrospirota bacterium]|nr:hypothetical protein [Nitrospirota bacterium]